MFVPPFGSRPTFEQALAAPNLRRRWYRASQAVLVGSIVAAAVLLSNSTETAQAAVGLLVVLGPGTWLFVGIFTWTRPSRILLLRPFQSRKVSKGLRRFVRRHVAFSGHTFTLADKYVKESRWQYYLNRVPRGVPDLILIPLFWIPFIRQFERWINVRKARDYRFLQKRLRRRFTLNLFWVNSINKILKVRSSDEWWTQCVDLLMYNSQLIVADLSWVKAGTEWELAKIDARNLERKSVFVVAEDNADYARQVIRQFWPREEAPPTLHVYSRSGTLQDPAAFDREVAKIVSESHLWQRPHPAAPGGRVLTGAQGG